MLRFHRKTGVNIDLEEEGTVAIRTCSFSNAIVFSNRPLMVNETFLFEIQDCDPKWAGYLRCGVTLHNPKKTILPQFLVPDLMNLGQSWVFAIKPSIEHPFGNTYVNPNLPRSLVAGVEKCREVTVTQLHSDLLAKSQFAGCEPTGEGSRVGLHLTEEGSLYYIINGVQYGPCVSGIPLKQSEVYAVVDLYGITKKIRLVHGVGRLSYKY